MNHYKVALPAQRGVVLVLTLLFLVALTLLVLSLFETALLQNKMVNNLSNRDVAFLRAESGLGAAERMLATQPVTGVVTGKGWRYVCASSTTQCDSEAIGCYGVTATGQAGHAKVVLHAVYQLNAIKNEEGVANIRILRRSWVESN